MSAGNLKTDGQKGNNFPYQYKALMNLVAIAANTGAGGGLATEATLSSVLTSLQNGQEFEQNLVMDLGGVGCPGNCPTYQQIRLFNNVTHTFDPPIYYDASGAVVVPVGPLEIVNPQYTLENILVQAIAIVAALGPLATEATLAAFSAKFDAVSRIPTMVRSAGAGTVPAGSRSASFFNAGLSNAIVLGAALLPGEQVSFAAGAEDDTLAVIAYDGTGTDLLVTYVS